MKIAVASGKGGTGKTTLSVAIAKAVHGSVALLDCDVEEPNCHLFFHRKPEAIGHVKVAVPVVNQSICTGCRKCAALCEFNAIVSFAGAPALVFPELCHSCGGCVLVCSEGAINEIPHEIGMIERMFFGEGKELITGRLNIGHAMAPPVIRAVNRELTDADLIVIDSPPGTSCPFVTSVKEADFAIFVTEPTPFGLHDLKLAVETVREIGTPFGVVINRMEQPDNRITEYCCKEGITVLLQIQSSRYIAETIAGGGSLLDADPTMGEKLRRMVSQIESTIQRFTDATKLGESMNRCIVESKGNS